MKKTIALSVLGIVIVAGGLFGAWWFLQNANAELINQCVENKDIIACQELVDKGLPSVEKCHKKKCAEVGLIYFELSDFTQALAYFDKGCSFNDGKACNRKGLLYSEGRGVEKSYTEALNLYKKACDLKFAFGCYNVGILYEDGRGVKRDLATATTFYEKACNLKDAGVCFMAGGKYHKQQNMSKALQMYHKACEFNDENGCFASGLLYEVGQGTGQNFATAKKYYERACEAKHGKACNNLAQLYENGKGIKTSAFSNEHLYTAKEYYGQACELGVQEACAKYQEFDTMQNIENWITLLLNWLSSLL